MSDKIKVQVSIEGRWRAGGVVVARVSWWTAT